MDTTPPDVEPLSKRMPGYLVAFGVGAAASALVGLVVWLASSARFTDSLGYAFLGLGTVLLLIGGARGGGYTNLGVGAVEAVFGGRNRTHDDFEADAELRHGRVMKKRDPMERLRRGLRPQANPTAFWQVIGGFAYLAIGAALTLLPRPPG